MDSSSFKTNQKKTGEKTGVEKNFQLEKENKVPILTVSELNSKIRKVLEEKYPVLWVQGEVSNFKAPSSGHFYFYIKDARSSVRCVMFKSYNKHLEFQLKEGLGVLVCGRVTVYEPRGDYQIFCETIRLKGVGDLHLAFEALKEKLKKEGLFDESHKKKLPFLSKHIVIVTSLTGAAIRDILNVLRRRFKGLKITLIPSLVQGREASLSLVKSVQKAKQIKDADVLILARGGGSIEDLWCFNDEKLVRELFHFPYPVISAVGHEIDFTLSDFVADVRAPTPSAAAELVIKERALLIEKLEDQYRRLAKALESQFDLVNEMFKNIYHRLKLVHPEHKLKEASIECDEWMQRLTHSMLRFLKEKNWHLKKIGENFNHLSPLEVLKRGYVIVRKKGKVIYESHQLAIGDKIYISFRDKDIESEVTSL